MPADNKSILCRFLDQRVSFVRGSVSLQIPPQYADRSKLLCNLREHADSGVEVPLAVSVQQLQAWKACVQAIEAHTRGGPQPLAAKKDDILLAAMQAADFLQDEDLIHHLARTLSHAFDPQPTVVNVSGKARPHLRRGTEFEYMPSKRQRTRVCKIVKALAPHLTLAILSAVQPTPEVEGDCSSYAWQNFWDQIVFLLLLLPPSCHPAILQARLPDIHRRRTLTIPRLPEHPAMDDASPARASPLVQVLSAAAVLAGGQPHRIWDPDADHPVPPHRQLSPLGFPIEDANPRKRRRDAQEPEAGAAGPCSNTGGPAVPLPVAPVDFAPATALDAAAALTRLELMMCGSMSPSHLLRSFSALAQLKTLCELQIDAPVTSESRACVESTLEALPALTQFHINVNSCGGVLFTDAGRLVRSISALPNLVDLSLQNLFPMACARIYKQPASNSTQAREAVLSLSRLTNLTRLSLGVNNMHRTWAGVAAEALGALSGLQELCVWGTSEFTSEYAWLQSRGVDTDVWDRVSGGEYSNAEMDVSDGESLGGEFDEALRGANVHRNACRGDGAPFSGPLVLHVCRCTTLPALRSLDAGETYSARPADYVRCLHADAGSGAVLRQLTALDLRHCAYGRSDAGSLRTLLTRLTGLRSLNLAGNIFRDVGLGAVAEALPALTALTCLDVSDTQGTGAGVRQVVEAAEKLLVGGEGGLRRLAAASMLLRDAGAIAAGLGRLVGLEELVLCDTKLPIVGISAVLDALPRLTLLDVSYCGLAVADAAVFAQAAGLQRLEIESVEEWHRYDAKDGDVGYAARGGDAVKEAIVAAAPWLTVVARSTWQAEHLILF